MVEDTGSKQKRKRPNFTSEEHNFIINEVYANKESSKLKKQGELFAVAALRLNESGLAKAEVDGHGVRDLFFLLTRKWRSSDNYKRSLTGSNEDFTDEYRKLSDMVAALDDIEEALEALRKDKKEKKDKQQKVDEEVLLYATTRKAGSSRASAKMANSKPDSGPDDDKISTEEPITQAAPKKTAQNSQRKIR